MEIDHPAPMPAEDLLIPLSPPPTTPGSANPLVVDTYSLKTKFRMLLGVLQRLRAFKRADCGNTAIFPGTVQVQTQTDCTSRCPLCPHSKLREIFPRQSMDADLYHSLADECARAPELQGFALVLQNEPLLDKDLPRKIAYFREQRTNRALTFLVTNGIYLDPATADDLLASGLDMLHLSVNGYAREDFEALNQGKPYDLFRRNLQAFLARDLSKLGLQLSFIMTRSHRQSLLKAVAEYRRQGFKVHVHGISNRGGMVDQATFEEHAYRPAFDQLRTKLLKGLARFILPCCPYPFFQASILASGKLLLCTHDWGRKTIIGDAAKDGLRAAWNSKEANEVRQLMLAGRGAEIPACRECNVFKDLSFV